MVLISNKLPQGYIYPQITQAPINNYADFLNFFRGGHTIDDNLGAYSIQATVQYTMFSTAIASGHLTKLKNMSIPDEFLADIFLTETGSELGQMVFDRTFCEIAVAEARKSIPENDGEPHPYVGAVVVRNGNVLATGFRGETGEGRHAEYCALRKINDDVDNVDLSGCTVYTTLEPCSKRNSSNKTACATRLINAKAARVVYAMPDKDESVYGHVSLLEADILVVPFVAAGIALATCRMHSHGIERVTQRFADFTAGHICGVALYATGLLSPLSWPVRAIRESLCCPRLWRFSFDGNTRYVFEGT